MRIVCPSCSAAYEIPPERIAPGRPVRCARCAGTWVPLPVSVVTVPDPHPNPDADPNSATSGPSPEFMFDRTGPIVPPAPIRVPLHRRVSLSWPPSEPALLIGAWVLTALILLTAGWTAVARRTEIVHAWPPSERVYAALGLLPRPH